MLKSDSIVGNEFSEVASNNLLPDEILRDSSGGEIAKESALLVETAKKTKKRKPKLVKQPNSSVASYTPSAITTIVEKISEDQTIENIQPECNQNGKQTSVFQEITKVPGMIEPELDSGILVTKIVSGNEISKAALQIDASCISSQSESMNSGNPLQLTDDVGKMKAKSCKKSGKKKSKEVVQPETLAGNNEPFERTANENGFVSEKCSDAPVKKGTSSKKMIKNKSAVPPETDVGNGSPSEIIGGGKEFTIEVSNNTQEIGVERSNKSSKKLNHEDSIGSNVLLDKTARQNELAVELSNAAQSKKLNDSKKSSKTKLKAVVQPETSVAISMPLEMVVTGNELAVELSDVAQSKKFKGSKKSSKTKLKAVVQPETSDANSVPLEKVVTGNEFAVELSDAQSKKFDGSENSDQTKLKAVVQPETSVGNRVSLDMVVNGNELAMKIDNNSQVKICEASKKSGKFKRKAALQPDTSAGDSAPILKMVDSGKELVVKIDDSAQIQKCGTSKKSGKFKLKSALQSENSAGDIVPLKMVESGKELTIVPSMGEPPGHSKRSDEAEQDDSEITAGTNLQIETPAVGFETASRELGEKQDVLNKSSGLLVECGISERTSDGDRPVSEIKHSRESDELIDPAMEPPAIMKFASVSTMMLDMDRDCGNMTMKTTKKCKRPRAKNKRVVFKGTIMELPEMPVLDMENIVQEDWCKETDNMNNSNIENNDLKMPQVEFEPALLDESPEKSKALKRLIKNNKKTPKKQKTHKQIVRPVVDSSVPEVSDLSANETNETLDDKNEETMDFSVPPDLLIESEIESPNGNENKMRHDFSGVFNTVEAEPFADNCDKQVHNIIDSVGPMNEGVATDFSSNDQLIKDKEAEGAVGCCQEIQGRNESENRLEENVPTCGLATEAAYSEMVKDVEVREQCSSETTSNTVTVSVTGSADSTGGEMSVPASNLKSDGDIGKVDKVVKHKKKRLPSTFANLVKQKEAAAAKLVGSKPRISTGNDIKNVDIKNLDMPTTLCPDKSDTATVSSEPTNLIVTKKDKDNDKGEDSESPLYSYLDTISNPIPSDETNDFCKDKNKTAETETVPALNLPTNRKPTSSEPVLSDHDQTSDAGIIYKDEKLKATIKVTLGRVDGKYKALLSKSSDEAKSGNRVRSNSASTFNEKNHSNSQSTRRVLSIEATTKDRTGGNEPIGPNNSKQTPPSMCSDSLAVSVSDKQELLDKKRKRSLDSSDELSQHSKKKFIKVDCIEQTKFKIKAVVDPATKGSRSEQSTNLPTKSKDEMLQKNASKSDSQRRSERHKEAEKSAHDKVTILFLTLLLLLSIKLLKKLSQKPLAVHRKIM